MTAPDSSLTTPSATDTPAPAKSKRRLSPAQFLFILLFCLLNGIGAASIIDVVRADSRAQETADAVHRIKSDPQACTERPEFALMHICSELVAYDGVAEILASMVEEEDLPEYRSLIERGRIYALDHAAPTQLATFRRGLHVVMTVAIGQLESNPAETSKSVLSGVRTSIDLLKNDPAL